MAVHPRVCGEHYVFQDNLAGFDGSSPRVRGTFKLFRLIVSAIRFIPACAGNIFVVCLGSPEKSVHPRVCGEHIPRQLWPVR